MEGPRLPGPPSKALPQMGVPSPGNSHSAGCTHPGLTKQCRTQHLARRLAACLHGSSPILQAALRGRHQDWPHFADQQTEAQRFTVTEFLGGWPRWVLSPKSVWSLAAYRSKANKQARLVERLYFRCRPLVGGAEGGGHLSRG